MRRRLLPPRRTLVVPAGLGAFTPGRGVAVLGAGSAPAASPVAEPPAGRIDPTALAGRSPARPQPRRLFDPVRGRFRRLERAANLALSRWMWEFVPGIDRPYGWQLDHLLTVSEAEVAVRGLPAPFDGTRVLLLTDLHAGPFLSAPALRRTFDRLARLRPDVILLGGDLTTSKLSDLAPHRDAFASLDAPLGTWAVPGNHDHYTGAVDGMTRLLAEAGVGMLTNRAVPLTRGGARVVLAGVDDWNAGRPDLSAAMDAAAALGGGDGDVPVMLLSHNPDVFFEAARRGARLVFAGHTHGGQIRVPGLPVLVRMSRYRLDYGRYGTDAAEVIVSRGLGVSGVPLRIACSPEAVSVTLRAR